MMMPTIDRAAREAPEDFVGRYEAARARGLGAEIDDFLPDPGHPLRPAVLRELIRVDLGHGPARGRSRRVEDYLRDYPELAEDRDALREVAFEEFRRRRLAGEAVPPEDYRRRFGIETGDWPERWRRSSSAPGRPSDRRASRSRGAAPSTILSGIDPFATTDHVGSADLGRVASSYLEFRLGSERDDAGALEGWCGSIGGDSGPARMFRDLHLTDPDWADRLARGVVALPEPGSDFLGFRLVEELGRGAFGRVFLARQGELADRFVALKVSAEMAGESRTLAQLQHTNIVPIFSVHRADPLQAVCMPYFGATTLGDVFDDLESRGTVPDSGQALLKALSSRRSSVRSLKNPSGPANCEAPPAEEAPAERPDIEAAKADAPAELTESLRLLGGLPYVEAVLWLGMHLADGLAHAHARGILHRDLKPANILLTDDGQPMLLDFNLSEDTKQESGASASMGGTLPYMSPEHLDAFRGGDRPVDARSDLYSLGVILYELLTGRHPFEVYPGHSPSVIAKMIEDRRGATPDVRACNPQVSPAVASIVRQLLQPEPERRYQSARDLHEDLERHLANLPLKHAPEPSLRERARKWMRRHPRLTSSTSIGAFAASVLVIFGLLFAAREQRLAWLEANAELAEFRDELATVQVLLNTRSADRGLREQGAKRGRLALARYRVLTDREWEKAPAYANLADGDRRRLREDIGEALLLLARSEGLDAEDRPDREGRESGARAAQRLCDLAAGCFGPGREPAALWTQRAELAALLGRKDEAEASRARAAAQPPRTARDHYLAATGLAIDGEFRKAMPLAREATRRDPSAPWAWFILAFCHDKLEQSGEAAACYGTCIALRPKFAHAWLNRGLVLLHRAEHALAIADFDRAAEIRPNWYEPPLNRGVAALESGRPAEAARDLSRALELGAPETRIYFLRALARERSGDAEGARRDREVGLTKRPTEETSWVARGMARLDKDPQGALADFREALKLNPRYLPALQDAAHVLGETGRNDESIAMLDRAVDLYPDYVPARSGRGVMLAIKGDREAAVRDAKESLWRDTSPRILYQVAGIYATTSRKNPDDRLEAFRLLSTALRSGFGFEYLEDDRELDPIRSQPEFRQILAAAKALLAVPPQRGDK